MTSLSKKLNTSAKWIAVRFLVASIVGVFVTITLVKCLSVEEFGIYNLLFAILSYVSLFSSFGLPSVFQRFIPEAYQKEEFSTIARIVKNGLLLRLVLALAAVGIVYLFSDQLGRLFDAEGWVTYFRIFAVGIILFLEIGLLTSALNGMFQHKYTSIGNIIWIVLRGVLMGTVLIGGYGLTGVLYVETVSWLILFLFILWAYSTRFLKQHTTEENGSFPMRRILRFGGFSFFA